MKLAAFGLAIAAIAVGGAATASPYPETDHYGCTPGMYHCSLDGKSLLLCNKDNYYDKIKDCPACCRYGTHGYADCYTQCDPSKPPEAEAVAERDVKQPPSCPANWLGARCQPGWLTCDKTKSYLMVCDGKGDYHCASNCGQGQCLYTDQPHEAYCRRTENQQVEPTFKRAEANVEPPWRPGAFTCDEWEANILTCTPERKWEISSSCGKERGCCKANAQGLPFCDCRNKFLKREAQTSCTPGTYSCNGNSTRLQTCNPDGQWVTSSICGEGCCKEPTNGTAFCDCRSNPVMQPSAPLRPVKIGGDSQSEAQIDAGTKRDASEVAVRDENTSTDTQKCQCGNGAIKCSPGNENVLVCEGCWWKTKQKCGGKGCCIESGLWDTYASCAKRKECNPKRELPARSPAPAAEELAIEPVPEKKCKYGTLSCDGEHEALLSCNAEGKWILKQHCGKHGDCLSGGLHVKPRCKNPHGATESETNAARDAVVADTETGTHSIDVKVTRAEASPNAIPACTKVGQIVLQPLDNARLLRCVEDPNSKSNHIWKRIFECPSGKDCWSLDPVTKTPHCCVPWKPINGGSVAETGTGTHSIGVKVTRAEVSPDSTPACANVGQIVLQPIDCARLFRCESNHLWKPIFECTGGKNCWSIDPVTKTPHCCIPWTPLNGGAVADSGTGTQSVDV